MSTFNSTSALILLLSIVVATVEGHQSMSFPTSISHTKTCRIGLGKHCPGPCPTFNIRADQSPSNPAVIVRRGQTLRVKTYKNNHVGGFARWSIVKIHDMYNKQRHRRYAFLYSCADVGLTRCNSYNRAQYCPYDRYNEYYQHRVKIPKVYPDGDYIFSFAWYGGLLHTGTQGTFGDYYDCSYIRIRGGPYKGYHKPTFKTGPSLTAHKGYCAATVNQLGVCWREPCPNSPRKAYLMKPAEFTGRTPEAIRRNMFPRRR